jgi:hypothetical protein
LEVQLSAQLQQLERQAWKTKAQEEQEKGWDQQQQQQQQQQQVVWKVQRGS